MTYTSKADTPLLAQMRALFSHKNIIRWQDSEIDPHWSVGGLKMVDAAQVIDAYVNARVRGDSPMKALISAGFRDPGPDGDLLEQHDAVTHCISVLSAIKDRPAASTRPLQVNATGTGLVFAEPLDSWSLAELVKAWAKRDDKPDELIDISVRQHTTYSVNRYIAGRNSGSHDTVADGLSLSQANELARALGASRPNVQVSAIGQDIRGHSEAAMTQRPNTYLQPLFNYLRNKPKGTSLRYTLVPQQRIGEQKPTYAVREEILTPELSQSRAKPACEWDEITIGTMREMEQSLRAMPYPLAAAMKRNAFLTKDQPLLDLFDRCVVATDVHDPSKGPAKEGMATDVHDPSKGPAKEGMTTAPTPFFEQEVKGSGSRVMTVHERDGW